MKATKFLLLNTLFIALAIFVPSADAGTLVHRSNPEKQHTIASVGYASYYSNHYNGRKTANGERFSNAEYTAASNQLPLGSRVRVTNVKNHRSVVVRVTDRGPFVKGRSIDLSRRAAEDLEMLEAGVIRVEITRLS